VESLRLKVLPVLLMLAELMVLLGPPDTRPVRPGLAPLLPAPLLPALSRPAPLPAALLRPAPLPPAPLRPAPLRPAR